MKGTHMRSGTKSKLALVALSTLAVGASGLAVGALGPAVQSAAERKRRRRARPRVRVVLGPALSVRRPGRFRAAARCGSPSARRHPGSRQEVEPHRDRRLGPRPHAARARREPDLRRAARPRSSHPRAGDRAHRHVRRHERGRGRISRIQPRHHRRRPAPPPTPPSRRRLTTRWPRCSPSQTPTFDAALAADLAAHRTARESGGHRGRSQRRRRHPGAPRQ